MKKVIIFILSALILLCMGCSKVKNDDNAEPSDNKQEETIEAVKTEIKDSSELEKLLSKGELLGIEVSGKTPEEACSAILQAVSSYSLSLQVNGHDFSVTSEMLNLSIDEGKLEDTLQNLEKGEDISADTVKEIMSFDTSAAVNMVKLKLNIEPKNAYLQYSKSSDKFIIVPEENGQNIPEKQVSEGIAIAVYEQKSSLSMNVELEQTTPEVSQDSQKAKSAAEKANNMLSVSLTYTYTPDGGDTSSEVISRQTVASLLYEDGLDIGISTSALNSYVAKMDKAHSVTGKSGKFKTTGGEYLNISVTYGGQSIDKTGLFNDISYCIKNCISGTRTAPYTEKSAYSDYMFGGNYVEIDLNSQHIWVYNKGKCVVSSSIVSGSVVDNNMTSTGLYSIQNKATDTYLVGPTWRDWVYFWMSFYGGYGMHDADGWRCEYGGDIYLYNGSHGCVNMPYSAARDTYNNVSVGTKVILYGGAQSVDMTEQSITGTQQYTVPVDNSPFTLDAAAKYSAGQLKYTSSDTTVAEVNANGTVTVKAVGTCTITVESPASGQYTYASMNVTVKVISSCDAGDHSAGAWSILKEPTCIETGERAQYCTVCGQKIAEEVLPAHGHDFGENLQYCTYGCGSENPNYIPPEDSGVDG